MRKVISPQVATQGRVVSLDKERPMKLAPRRRARSLALAGLLAALALPALATALSPALAPAEAASRLAPTRTALGFAGARSATACGGVALAKPGGGWWRCTFTDEFTGTTLDRSKWVPQLTASSGYRNGPECYLDRAANIAVGNGVLTLTARRETTPFICHDPLGGDFTTSYTSGMVSTWGLFTQTYGRFEIRARFPAATVAGLQSSLWLYPQDTTRYGPWPASGEIDIAEEYSRYPDRAIPYLHYATATVDPTVTNTGCLVSKPSAFHTYVAEWSPTGVTILFDGRTCLRHTWNPASPLTGSQPFDQPFFVALTQALGQATNAFDPATTPLPATTTVDYVRVWS